MTQLFPTRPPPRFGSRYIRLLRARMDALADALGRDITVLDIGGGPAHWRAVGFARVARIEMLNPDPAADDPACEAAAPRELFLRAAGELSGYADASVDLVHAASGLERAGTWAEAEAMAAAMMRVGRAGWIRAPAWEFPIEPWFRVPFGHWFGKPVQARLLALSPEGQARAMDWRDRRQAVERVNPLSGAEMRALFPGRAVLTEGLLWPRGHVAHWVPARAEARPAAASRRATPPRDIRRLARDRARSPRPEPA